MAAPITITLAGEPKGKGRPRFARATGRAFTPAATRSYEDALRYAAQMAMGDRVPMTEPLGVIIEAHMPIPQSWSKRKRAGAISGLVRATCKPDIDNIMKMVDALKQVVFVDDKQIIHATASKRYSEKPNLTIHITPLVGAV